MRAPTPGRRGGRAAATVPLVMMLLLVLLLASSALAFVPSGPRAQLQQQQQRRPSPLSRLHGFSNQLQEEGLTVQGVVDEYNAKKEAKRKAEDAEAARLRAEQLAGGNGGTGVLGTLRRATESKAFLALEGGMVLALLALLDGAWSGDWTRYDYISYATEGYMKAASIMVVFAHVCLAGLAGVVAEAKGRNDDAVVHILRTLLVGGVDFFRVAVMADRDQLDAMELARAPPLRMEISTFQMAQTKANDGVLLSTTIKTLPGKEGAMRKLLVKLVEQSVGKEEEEVTSSKDKAATSSKSRSPPADGMEGLLSTIAVNQDPEDGRNFLMLQRFPSIEKMKVYQNGQPFRDFTTAAHPLLSEPFGLYIVNERKGKLTEPNYPFGPGGEGGRDDAIYSSPSNLDGSQSGISRGELVGRKTQ